MKKTSFFAALLAAAAFLALPLSGWAGILTITGNNTNAPVFNRPTETGALSFQNPHYNAYVIRVDASGPYSFNLVAADPANFDTFLHLYQFTFNPADPAANFYRANDDGPNGTNAGSALSNVQLNVGIPYYLVADGFSVLDYGAYTSTISGPGNISAVAVVPEPSSLALAGMTLLAGGAFAARRMRRRALAAAL